MNIISRDGSQIVSDVEVKANSRITTDAEDSLIQIWLDVAHDYAEKYAGLVLQQSIVETVTDLQEVEITAPVRGLISVKLYDADQVETTTTDYTYEKLNSYGLSIKLDAKPENYAVIRYVAGFGAFTATTETAINEGTITAYPQLKQAILLLTNHFYENRGLISDFNKYVLPVGIERLLDQVVKYK